MTESCPKDFERLSGMSATSELGMPKQFPTKQPLVCLYSANSNSFRLACCLADLDRPQQRSAPKHYPSSIDTMSVVKLDQKTLFAIDGKSVVVTGGGQGIGLMIAKSYIQNNAAYVFISSRKAQVCEEACKLLNSFGHPGKAISVPGDLTKKEDIERLVAEVSKITGGKLNILVNNSGNNWGEDFDTYPDKAWDRVIGLNLKSVFIVSQQFTPLLEATATEADPSRIIHIGSVDGNKVPIQGTFAYSASKAALQMMSKTLAAHLGPRLITSNVIACGPFVSHMMKHNLETAGDAIKASIPLGRIGRDADVGGTCVFLSAHAGSYINGAVIPLEGGYLCSNGQYYESPNL